MKRALIFPGQGAQYVGMGKDFFDSFQIAKETFQEADEFLNFHLSKIIFEGPEELLTQTKNSQVAIFVTSVAILRTVRQQVGLYHSCLKNWELDKEAPEICRLERGAFVGDKGPSENGKFRVKPTQSKTNFSNTRGIQADVCAGLSLGEYTALYASGRLGFKETLMLVKERARLMNEACEKTSGTMAAVLGLDAIGVEAAVVGLKGVWVANYNAPGQIVISGTSEGVEKASVILKEKGAKRVIPLTVHGAFHSGLMQTAQDGLKSFVEKVEIAPSEIEFVMNVPGDFVKTNEEIRRNLICQVTQSVRWEQGIEAMKAAGVVSFVEVGCGKTLTGLNRKMGVTSMSSVEKVTDLELIHAVT